MPYNLLLLPLLGGYIFVRRCYRTRYGALRSENYRLLFLAAEFGLYLLILAAVLRYLFLIFGAAIPSVSYVDHLWHSIIPFDYSGTAFLAFFLGNILWWPVNWATRSTSEDEVDKSIRDKADPFEVLLKDAMRNSKPVLMTIKSGKVYVGHVVTNFNPAFDVQSVKIIPILSGYRKTEDQTISFTTDYFSLLTRIHNQDPTVSDRDRMDLGTVIPVEEVRSVAIFSLPAYKQFFSNLTNHATPQDHP
jgi:hypothetical protein